MKWTWFGWLEGAFVELQRLSRWDRRLDVAPVAGGGQGSPMTVMLGNANHWPPDLLAVSVADDIRWVLPIAVADAGPIGHSGVVAFVGTFDGQTFESGRPAQPIDHGPDFYAAQSFSNVAGDPLLFGWRDSWQYSNTHPSRGQRGVLSLPRRFRLDDDETVVQQPAFAHRGVAVGAARRLSSARDEAYDLLVSDSTLHGRLAMSALFFAGETSTIACSYVDSCGRVAGESV